MKTLLLLLCSLPVLAQQTPIVQKLFSAVTVAAPSSTVQNQGQVSHLVYVQMSNAAGQTCTSPNFSGRLEASFDGSSWLTFGTPQVNYSSVGSALSGIYVGTGAFNYVRFNAVSWDTTNCALTAWYTGIFAAGLVTQADGMVMPGSVIRSSTSAWGAKPVFIGGLGTQTLNPLTLCDQTASATITAGTTTRVVTANGNNIHVCGFALVMVATGTAQFVTGNGATCATNTATVTPAFPLLAKTPFVWGGGMSELFFPSAVSAGDLCVAAVTGDVVAMVRYATLP